MSYIESKNYDITNYDNYNFNMDENSNSFILKYYIIITDYIQFFIDNINNISFESKKKYKYYIFIKGIEILKNIVNILLIYTNNIDLVVFHCHKAYLYYIEFITQLDTENNHLELTINDGTLFVYKKNIFELKESITNLNSLNSNTLYLINRQKIINIEKIVNIINIIVKLFMVKKIINLTYTIDNDNNEINTILIKVFNKLTKLFTNENEYCIVLSKLEDILYNILNYINSHSNNNDFVINNYNLLIFVEKIINKFITLTNKMISKINVSLIIDDHFFENINNNKIKTIINNI
tara:strand:- start:450 stop:1331 length:882 start_codon:yes stop_codon:yes gene_type:complete